MDAKAFMQELSVSVFLLHADHQDILGGKKGQLLPEMLLHHRREQAQAGDDIFVQIQNPVAGQKRLRDGDAAVGGIIQRAFQPLGGRRESRVLKVAHHIARQRRNAFTAHGVSLIGHGRRADLSAFKGFFQLPEMAQQPDVSGKFAGALGNAAEDLQHGEILLAGIGLPAYLLAGGKAHLLRDYALKLQHLFFVPVKESQETRRRSGRALAAQKPQLG